MPTHKSTLHARTRSDPKDGIALHEDILGKRLIHKFANNHAANIRSSPYQDAIDSHLKGRLKLIEAYESPEPLPLPGSIPISHVDPLWSELHLKRPDQFQH